MCAVRPLIHSGTTGLTRSRLQHEHSHYSYRGGWVGKRIMSRVAHKQDKQEIP